MRVIDLMRELESCNVYGDVDDPWIDPAEARQEYGVQPLGRPESGVCDGVVLAVAYDRFHALGTAGIRGFGTAKCILDDGKHVHPANEMDGRL